MDYPQQHQWNPCWKFSSQYMIWIDLIFWYISMVDLNPWISESAWNIHAWVSEVEWVTSESKQEPKESGHDFERSTQDKRTIKRNDYTQCFLLVAKMCKGALCRFCDHSKSGLADCRSTCRVSRLKSAFATAPSHVDETQHIWIRWIVLYFVVLKSFLNMCPFLTKVVLSACEVSVAQGLYWCSVEMKRFTRAIIYDVSSPSMLASVAVQRTTGVAMFEDLRGPKTRVISWCQGDTHIPTTTR